MGGTIHPVYVCELTSPAFRGALAASGVRLILIKQIKGCKLPRLVVLSQYWYYVWICTSYPVLTSHFHWIPGCYDHWWNPCCLCPWNFSSVEGEQIMFCWCRLDEHDETSWLQCFFWILLVSSNMLFSMFWSSGSGMGVSDNTSCDHHPRLSHTRSPRMAC